MAFTSKRGRPRAYHQETDSGTPELQLKKAFGVTEEPLDLCLQRGIITPGQHRAGMHLRWLHTLRYGAPVITTRYETILPQNTTNTHDETWQCFREMDFHEAVNLLKQAHLYEPILRLCVYHIPPSFLDKKKLCAATNKPLLISQIEEEKHSIIRGLDLLKAQWKLKNS